MKPLDLPPDNLDRLHAALCRPAEVRETYLSRPPEDDGHDVEHVEVVRPALPLPPMVEDEPPPGQQMLVVPRWYEEQRRQALVAATNLLYRNHALYAATAAPE